MVAKACGCCGKPPGQCTCWEFPGWGKVENIVDLSVDPAEAVPEKPTRLGAWRATAICGNDITSSCLYVSALAAFYAGPLAPLALLLVAGVLYLFRGIYAEVGSALPLNGGAYNVLLNTTTKGRAAVAACLTLLSYIATAVISGTEAMSYAGELFAELNILWATVVLLGGFALLNIMGISDSATVALAIFAFHILTLTVLVAIGVAALLVDPSVLADNLKTPISEWPTPRSGSAGVLVALFFGFSAAMLGISGFESSANYIEEQQRGVFPKTLRNMWIAVALFNPAISFLSFALLPMADIATHKEKLAGVYTLSFLAVMALFAIGNLLLKQKHPDLRRTHRASVPTIVVALIGVSAALVGNVLLDPDYVSVFSFYFAIAVAIVMTVFFRSKLLTGVLSLGTALGRLPLFRRFRIGDGIAGMLQEVQCRSIIFVASKGTVEELRSAAEYVVRNEQLRFLKVVWCYDHHSEIPAGLGDVRQLIDREFPELHIDLLLVRGSLDPALLASLAKRFGVSPNYLFITTVTAAAAEDLASWGGVRILA